jgi:hypothetical protein
MECDVVQEGTRTARCTQTSEGVEKFRSVYTPFMHSDDTLVATSHR